MKNFAKGILLLAMGLLFGCPVPDLYPSGGGTISRFEVKEADTGFTFSWNAVDLSAYQKAWPKYADEKPVYEICANNLNENNERGSDLSLWMGSDTSVTLTKEDFPKTGIYCVFVRCKIGENRRESGAYWYYISRQIDIDVTISGEIKTYPINNFRYEETSNRYLFLWDPINFDSYSAAAGDSSAKEAEEKLFYTVKVTDASGNPVFVKTSGKNTELSVEKTALPSSEEYTVEVFYEYFVSTDISDSRNVAYKGSLKLPSPGTP